MVSGHTHLSLARPEKLGHVLTDDEKVDLKKLPSAKGIWAPCLTYCEQEDLFYVVYGVMDSMNARYFDVDNFVITARDIRGPWSEPVYLHSAEKKEIIGYPRPLWRGGTDRDM